MSGQRSPTLGLLAGLAVTLSAVAVYSGYTIAQLRSLRRLQEETIDRNRRDSLLLLRIQNNLNSISLAMRDMLDATEPYPLTAWQGQFRRIRTDLEDAVKQEAAASPSMAGSERDYLAVSITRFWDALEGIFTLAGSGREEEARALIRLSLQARHDALTTAVARLQGHNNESDREAAAATRSIYSRAERNLYVFLGAMLLVVTATGLYLVDGNRRVFRRITALSERRSELARQLITSQESTFRYISRELHDEFGQILTAIGAMLQRSERGEGAAVRAEIQEVREIVQSTLDKVRALSRALHPIALEEAGFEAALGNYLPGFEKQTGIAVRYEKTGSSRPVEREVGIHLYRIAQEALNNVARHSRSKRALVRLSFEGGRVVMEVEDEGAGFGETEGGGMGMISMRERAELIHGRIEFLDRMGGGAAVRLTVPLAAEAHAEA